MASSMNLAVVMFMLAVASSFRFVSSSSPSLSMCRPHTNTFVDDLKLQCRISVSSSWPIEMDGESLDRALSSGEENVNTAILFYASWCPFSNNVQSKFTALSSMFPQIKHLMVEQSSALPSIFSRYGIHSVPAILMVNQTVRVRHHGPKDLHSLVLFYKRTTALDQVMDLTEDQISYPESCPRVFQLWNGTSPKEIFMREPYLLFSLFFLFLKAFLYLFPEIVSDLIALWVAYIPHLNLAIFGESRQILGRVLHLIDKLNLYKSRNFHKGARSARVWASSLASVSLGKTSSVRTSHGGDL